MDQFYLTLPSNSISCSNKQCLSFSLSDFRVRLPQNIRLVDGDWEVGLSEIIYPHTWFNISGGDDNWFTFSYDPKSTDVRCVLPPGHYGSPQELIDVLNFSIFLAATKLKLPLPPLKFEYDKIQRRVCIAISKPNDIPFMGMANKLKYILGFDTTANKLYPEPTALTVAQYPVDIRGGFYALYVYCDLVDNQIVGNSIVPLLRTVNVEGQHDEVVCKVYDVPHYLPITRREFSSVEINIKDDNGRPVRFQYGKLIVKLHFRRKQQK